MTWLFPIYTLPMLLNVILSVWLAIVVWQRRSVPGVRVFAIMLIASGFWSLTRLLEAGVVEVWAKIFWGKIEYIGIVVVSPAWFVFTCFYRLRLKHFPVRYTILLAIVPVIVLALTWTNESHHLIWTTITPSITNPEVLNYGHGTAFWLSVVYNYSLLMVGIGNLILALRSLPEQYRSQAKFLLIGSFAPIAGNVLYLAGLSPVQGLDLTPFGLTVTAVIYFLSVFRFRLFDIRRIARTAIIENMTDGMLVLDENYHVVDVNPSASRLLGESRVVIDQDIRFTLTKYPAILAMIISPHPQHVTLAIGENLSLYLDIQVSELTDTDGKSAGKLVMLRDVTERRAMERHAFEMAIEQERVDLLSQFIRDVSHEFKTPLSVMNNSLYLMEKSADEQQQKKRRDAIHLQIHRLNYLISEMLTTVQLDADYPFEQSPINLNNLLQTLTQEHLPTFKAHNQYLTLNLASEQLQITGDVPMLKKALSNILENASRYTPTGGTITISLNHQPKFARIEITDSGVGMNAETTDRIFERFYRADDAHSTPGFGLGLPIAQSIIVKHKGWVDVNSSLGVGTTFALYLPLSIEILTNQPILQLASN